MSFGVQETRVEKEKRGKLVHVIDCSDEDTTDDDEDSSEGDPSMGDRKSVKRRFSQRLFSQRGSDAGAPTPTRVATASATRR